MKQATLIRFYIIIAFFLLLTPAFSEDADSLKHFGVGFRVSSMNIGTTNFETGQLGDFDGKFNGTAAYGLNLTYFITPRYSIELSTDTLKARVKVRYEEDTGNLGEITQRPTLITGRVHFTINQLNGNFFLGAGVGHYYNDFKNDMNPSESNDFFAKNMQMDIRESFGAHLVAGAEYFISDHFALNLDIKLILNQAEANFRPFNAPSQERDISMNASFLGIGLKYYF